MARIEETGHPHVGQREMALMESFETLHSDESTANNNCIWQNLRFALVAYWRIKRSDLDPNVQSVNIQNTSIRSVEWTFKWTYWMVFRGSLRMHWEICVAAIRVFNEHYSQLQPFGRVQKCFWNLSGLNGDRLTGMYPSNFGNVQSSIKLYQALSGGRNCIVCGLSCRHRWSPVWCLEASENQRMPTNTNQQILTQLV